MLLPYVGLPTQGQVIMSTPHLGHYFLALCLSFHFFSFLSSSILWVNLLAIKVLWRWIFLGCISEHAEHETCISKCNITGLPTGKGNNRCKYFHVRSFLIIIMAFRYEAGIMKLPRDGLLGVGCYFAKIRL